MAEFKSSAIDSGIIEGVATQAFDVVVIGGGTAGLEAACTAAEVGCNTFLLEKGNELGGLASLISKIPAKNRLADFPHYLMHRAEQLDNLYIFKNTEGTPENIRKFHPNIIVSSTGSASASDRRTEGSY